MALHSEKDMTFTFPTTPHPPIRTATLAILTVHQEDTATAPIPPTHSWQDHITSNQTK